MHHLKPTPPIARVVAAIRDASPTCGRSVIIAIDGRSGAGKTTLATHLTGQLPHASLVHLDELYRGWSGLEDGIDLLRRRILLPLGSGRPASYEPYDWVRGSSATTTINLGVPALLIVEGVGAGARRVASMISVLVWVQRPSEERERVAMERDFHAYPQRWNDWAAAEARHYRENQTRSRADVVVDYGDPSCR